MQEAVEAARDGFDGFVGIGGGSALDTAKLCALFATHEGELLDYVNAPIGRGQAGARAGASVRRAADDLRHGIRGHDGRGRRLPAARDEDRRLAPAPPAGARDRRPRPDRCRARPGVTASVGVDALLHALEAYTVVPYDARPALPLAERPPYQGANPFSDPLCERAIELVGRNLRTAVSDGDDIEARTAMALASTIAGIAFSGAGVHVPHALAYPIASLKHEWKPPGYGGAALVPHGFAVAVTAPAVFRFIEDADPERCAKAARLLDGGDDLAASLERLLEDVGAPTTPARDRVRRGRPRGDRRGRARPAPAPRRLAEGGRRGRARGAAEGVAVSDPSAWPRGRDRRRRDDGRRHLARLRLERHPDRARRQHGGAGRGGARARRSSCSRGSRRPATSARARRRRRARHLTAAASVDEGVDGADLIVEAVVERPDVKARRLRGDRGGRRQTAR